MSSSFTPLYAGIDCSTQSLKIILIDAHKRIHQQVTINYDQDLPSYGTRDGIIRSSTDATVISTPSLMLAEAMELAWSRITIPHHHIIAISGSGQQHGSVYLTEQAEKVLKELDEKKSLVEQLKDGKVLAVENGPIWMDSSTSTQCASLEKHVGGAQALADICGARAYQRFTGNQIAKLHQTSPATYLASHHISLISSFLPSLLIGSIAPIDASDACGMNLMNLSTCTWDDTLLQATVPDDGKTRTLKQRLGEIVPSSQCVGKIHPYWVSRYGFSPSCVVYAFSGDNPCSLAGMELAQEGDIGISLGTSDTIFGITSASLARPSGTDGFILINPVDVSTRMLMLVFANGSLTRTYIRDQMSNPTWQQFNDNIEKTPVGCNGNMGFYFHEYEITPTTQHKGIIRFDNKDNLISSFEHDSKSFTSMDCRAILEWQFLSMRHHMACLGLHQAKRIVAVGGASSNHTILQIAADVFQVPVDTQQAQDASDTPVTDFTINTAALGAAYRALLAHTNTETVTSNGTHKRKADDTEGSHKLQKTETGAIPINQTSHVALVRTCLPRKEYAATYDAMLARFGELETKALQALQSS